MIIIRQRMAMIGLVEISISNEKFLSSSSPITNKPSKVGESNPESASGAYVNKLHSKIEPEFESKAR